MSAKVQAAANVNVQVCTGGVNVNVADLAINKLDGVTLLNDKDT